MPKEKGGFAVPRRSARRHKSWVAKKEASRKLLENGHDDLAFDKKYVGRQASVHSRACSCFLCTNTDTVLPVRDLKRMKEVDE